MRTDYQIKEDVLDELAWQPNIDETQIGVIVEDGVVTLNGTVDSYVKKRAAENAVKKVTGVRAVAMDIEVKFGSDYKKSDKEIAKAASEALKWDVSVPEKGIEIKVEDGWVFLTGEVEWSYQKEAARKQVEKLLGVKGVSNTITLKNEVKASEVINKIKKAFHRMANVDANNITLETHGHTVTLRGKVNSIKEKEDAEKAAYNAPGVYDVKNHLQVEYYSELV
jgi:osmotically-inducible protein OsmY